MLTSQNILHVSDKLQCQWVCVKNVTSLSGQRVMFYTVLISTSPTCCPNQEEFWMPQHTQLSRSLIE